MTETVPELKSSKPLEAQNNTPNPSKEDRTVVAESAIRLADKINDDKDVENPDILLAEILSTPTEKSTESKNPKPHKEHQSTEKSENQYAQWMHKSLEEYVKRLVKEGKNPQDVERVMQFFTSQESGATQTPLERISEVYGFLDLPQDEAAAQKFRLAIAQHSQELARRAFDQHLENPEQFVSHGFDHAINVADYTRGIYEQNPQIISNMSKLYGVTEGEAKFLLESVALFHDVGYPDLKGRKKAVHGISGAEMISTDTMRASFDGLLQHSSESQKNLIMNDLRNSILFHSADKVEEDFEVKVDTTKGTFLTEDEDVTDLISEFDKTEITTKEGAKPKSKLTVQVSDMESLLGVTSEIEDAKKAGQIIEAPEVVIMGEQTLIDGKPTSFFPIESKGAFEGRRADIDHDIVTGLEFSEVDLLRAPLHAMVRMADNMDMRTTRFSATQREGAFQAVYRAYGDTRGEIAQKLIQLEAAVSAKKAPAEELRAFKDQVISDILGREEYVGLSEEIKTKIRRVALSQDSVALRHFGGCEAINDLSLNGSSLTITVDAAKYKELNAIIVDEKNNNGELEKVGVGEYQIWRLKQAYSSITFDDRPIEVKVVDEQGMPIVTEPQLITGDFQSDKFNRTFEQKKAA